MSVKRRFRSTNEKRASDLMEGSGTIWKVPRYRFFCRLSAKMRRGRAERSGAERFARSRQKGHARFPCISPRGRPELCDDGCDGVGLGGAS